MMGRFRVRSLSLLESIVLLGVLTKLVKFGKYQLVNVLLLFLVPMTKSSISASTPLVQKSLLQVLMGKQEYTMYIQVHVSLSSKDMKEKYRDANLTRKEQKLLLQELIVHAEFGMQIMDSAYKY
jgi:hypothetical protein